MNPERDAFDWLYAGDPETVEQARAEVSEFLGYEVQTSDELAVARNGRRAIEFGQKYLRHPPTGKISRNDIAEIMADSL